MIRTLVIILLLGVVATAQPAPPTSTEREAGFLFKQGLDLLEDGQTARATELFRRALRLEPERLEIRPYLARSLYDSKDYEGALRQLDLYLNSEPEDHKVALFRVKTLAALENYGQASDALELLRHAQEESWEWHNLRGFLYQETGQLEAAEAAYLRAQELSTAEVYEPRANLIDLYLSQERTEEAAEIVKQMLSEAADDVRVLNAFALLLSYQEPGFDPAPLMEAVKEQSLPFELQYNLSAALAERQETAEAALLAADLVDRFPEEPRASWLYGRVLLQQRELQDAGEYLLAARDRIPTTSETLQTLGSYSYLVGDYEESVGWFRQAAEREPEDPAIAHNLSLALSRMDKLEEAAEVSRRAVELDNDEARYVYQLALVLDRDGKIEEASTQYRRFLELNEDEAQAAIVREHLSELKGDR
ncbi:MAG: tetratricopeptide repeat protein [Candidatus Eremiobacteraeota bacterium]|nr:tetratricopeptide repeat protein [Candidatus Eremiobacteraeota bacterium]